MYPAFPKHKVEKTDTVKDIWLDGEAEAPVVSAPPTTPVDLDETREKEEREGSSGVKPNSFRSPHLISPSDIMSLAANSVKGDDVAPNLMDVEDWQEETRNSKHGGSGTGFQDKVAAEVLNSIPRDESDVDEPTVTSLLGAFEGDNDRGTEFIEKDISETVDDATTTGLELPGLMAMAGIDDSQNEYFLEDKPLSDAESQDELKGMVVAKRSEAGVGASASQFPSPSTFKGRKSKNKNNGSQLLGSASSQPSSTPATLPTESSVGSGLVTQVATMQESLNQVRVFCPTVALAPVNRLPFRCIGRSNFGSMDCLFD